MFFLLRAVNRGLNVLLHWSGCSTEPWQEKKRPNGHFRFWFSFTFRSFPVKRNKHPQLCGAKPLSSPPPLPARGNISRRSLSTDEIIPGFSEVTTRFVDENSRTSSGVSPRLHLPDPPALHLPLFPFKLYPTFSPSISSSLIPCFSLSINPPLEPEGGIA